VIIRKFSIRERDEIPNEWGKWDYPTGGAWTAGNIWKIIMPDEYILTKTKNKLQVIKEL